MEPREGRWAMLLLAAAFPLSRLSPPPMPNTHVKQQRSTLGSSSPVTISAASPLLPPVIDQVSDPSPLPAPSLSASCSISQGYPKTIATTPSSSAPSTPASEPTRFATAGVPAGLRRTKSYHEIPEDDSVVQQRGEFIPAHAKPLLKKKSGSEWEGQRWGGGAGWRSTVRPTAPLGLSGGHGGFDGACGGSSKRVVDSRYRSINIESNNDVAHSFIQTGMYSNIAF
jgi:hypothetical protein